MFYRGFQTLENNKSPRPNGLGLSSARVWKPQWNTRTRVWNITNDFLNKLLTIGNLPANSLLVTLDVSSLYTNIPHNEGINACDHFLRTSSRNTIPTGTLCDLIRMILTMNNFCFNDNHYLQIHGTAMGTKMVPSYANLLLGYLEANALENAPFQPHAWLRDIDDIFMIWTEGGSG